MGASPAMAAGGGSVAVLDIITTAVDPKFVNIMTEILAVEIQALGVYDNVVAGRDIATMVGFERQREMIGCDHAECLVELGGALGVDRLVSGHIAKLGETFVVQIKLINITEQKTEARVYQTVKGKEDILIQTIKDSVGKLVPPKFDPNKNISTAAVPPPSPPGTNTVVHAHQGPSVAPWVLIGIGAVGTGVGAFFGSAAQTHLDNANDVTFVGAQREIASGEDKALYANISYGLGAVSAIGGIIWMLAGGDSHASHAGLVPLSDGAALTWGGQF